MHTIARLGTEPHQIVKREDGKLIRNTDRAIAVKDNTLAIMLGSGYYQFLTYKNDPKTGVSHNIEYGSKLEGWWNYVYFGYKRTGLVGQAKAFIQFGPDGNVEEGVLNVNHDFMNEYMEFVVGKSNVPFFNGYIAKIELLVGPGSFWVD